MEYIFNGEWEVSFRIDAFGEFQSRNGNFGNLSELPLENRKLHFFIEDELSDDPDPLIEQINTVNFVLNNQDSLIEVIFERVKAEYPNLVDICDYVQRPFDVIQSKEELKQIFSFSNVHILTVNKDGYAYMGFECGCNWDEEHGVGILLHKNRIVAFGEADTSFNSWEAYKDNGTQYDVAKEQQKLLEAPQKYQPHPKFNKLKPSQLSANECYIFYLITRGFTELFIELAENNDIDIEGFHKPSDDTCPEIACSANNLIIVKYLLSKKVTIRYALHKCRKNGDDTEIFELLLASGADINMQDIGGNTIIYCTVQQLNSIYNSKIQMDSWGKEHNLNAELDNVKTEIAKLIKRGCDPYIKNGYDSNCLDVMRNYNQEIQKDVYDYIKECLQNK